MIAEWEFIKSKYLFSIFIHLRN